MTHSIDKSYFVPVPEHIYYEHFEIEVMFHKGWAELEICDAEGYEVGYFELDKDVSAERAFDIGKRFVDDYLEEVG